MDIKRWYYIYKGKLIVDELIENIGKRILYYRKKNDTTLKELADKIKATPSLISQIEHGKANPSLATLKAIADVFSVPIGLFFENDIKRTTSSPVIRKNTHRKLITNGNVTYTLLNPDSEEMEVILIEFPPQVATGEEHYHHDGYEVGYVIKGELTVVLEDNEYNLQLGDSIAFRSIRPHTIKNKSSQNAVAVWVNLIPWIFVK